MLNIVCLAYRNQPDGVGRYFENLVKEVLQNNVDSVNAIIPSEGRENFSQFIENNFLTDRFGELRITYLKGIRSISCQFVLLKLIRQKVIFTGLCPCIHLGPNLRVIHDITFATNPDSLDNKQVLKKYVAFFISSISGTMVPISPETKREVQRKFPFLKFNPPFFLPNGLPYFLKQYPRRDLRGFEFVSSSKIKVCVVGSLNKHKGADRLIEFLISFSRGFGGKISCDIVGKVEEPWVSHLQSLNYDNLNISIHGFCSDSFLVDILYSAQVMCIFSRNEGFGLTVLEGIHAGCLPIMSSEVAVNFEEIQSPLVWDAESVSSEEFANSILSALLDGSIPFAEFVDQLNSAYASHQHGYRESAENIKNFFQG